MQLNVTKQNTSALGSGYLSEEFSWWKLYKVVSYLGAQAFIAYFITFLIFPGTMLATKFDFLNNNKSRQSWFDIIMISLHAFIDTFGRYMASVYVAFTKDTVLYLTLSRLAHIPQSIAIQLALPPGWLFQADWFRLLNVVLFSFTQGYNTALVMMFGPQKVRDSQRERAGMIMNFHLMGGLCISAMFAAFVMKEIPQHSHY